MEKQELAPPFVPTKQKYPQGFQSKKEKVEKLQFIHNVVNVEGLVSTFIPDLSELPLEEQKREEEFYKSWEQVF